MNMNHHITTPHRAQPTGTASSAWNILHTLGCMLTLTIVLLLSSILMGCSPGEVLLSVDTKATRTAEFVVQASDFTRDPQSGVWSVTKTIPEINTAFQSQQGGGVIVLRFRAGDWRVIPEKADGIQIGYAVAGNTLTLNVLSDTGQPLPVLPEGVGGTYRLLSL